VASGLGPAMDLFNRPALRRHVNSAFHFASRAIGGEIHEGEVNGVEMSFYDPGGGDDIYWISLYAKNRLYEHSVLTHMKRVASLYRKPTFVDVGAHYGFYTVYMSKLKGPESRVLSFEPNGEYFRVLSRNVKLNNADNVTLHQLALSDRKGHVVLETSKRFQVGHQHGRRKIRHIEDRVLGSPYHSEATPFDELGIDVSPFIIKVDVHGSEGNVIAGMKKTLQTGTGHLYCELHTEMCDGYTARDVIEMLEDAGMNVLELQGFRRQGGGVIPISKDLFSNPEDRMVYAHKSS
jgi:FkbM family methyltransferase